MIANLPGSVGAAAARRPRDRERAAAAAGGQRQRRDRRDLGRRTSCSRIPMPSRTTVPSPSSSRSWTRTRAAASPARRSAGPTAPGSRRAGASRPSPGTIVRRTPLRRLSPPYENQREHYLLDEVPTEPVEADWMLGAFLLQRRTMLDEIGGWDAGYRHYVEDIDLCYRAMRAGWERWYVPAADGHARLRGRDRQEVPLPPHALAPARHGPVRPQAPGGARQPTIADQLAGGSNAMPSCAPK